MSDPRQQRRLRSLSPLGFAVVAALCSHSLRAQSLPPAQSYVAAIGVSPLRAPLTADFSPGATFTMEGWVFVTGNASGWLMGKCNTGIGGGNQDPPLSFSIQTNGVGKLVFACGSDAAGSFREIATPSAVPLRTWIHIAAVMDNATTRLLLNGVVVATGTAAGAPPKLDNVAFGVGHGWTADSPAFPPFPGYARQLRFWNVARTAAQISAALTEILPTDRNGLVAAWPLDDAFGLTARDISGNARPLTGAYGAVSPVRPAVVAAGPFFADTVTKVTDGSLFHVFGGGGALIDFDGDGDLDAVFEQASLPPDATPRRLRAFRNDHGTFTDVTDSVLGDVRMLAPYQSEVGDFNGDGRADLLIAGAGYDAWPFPGEQSKLFIQSPDGRLIDETATRLPQLQSFTHDVTVADIDGDGDLDIYMVNVAGVTAAPRFYINDGHGFFTDDTSRIPIEITNGVGGLQYKSALLLDINGDHRPDLILGCGTETAPHELLLNDGTGHFVHDSRYALPPPRRIAGGGGVVNTISSDFNGDGFPDLAFASAANATTTGIQILLNRGDGTFRDVTDTSGIIFHGVIPEWVVYMHVTDLNGDGRPDLVLAVSNFGGLIPRIFINQGASAGLLFSDATDTYGFPPAWTGFVMPGDFDRDGRVDLLTVGGSGEDSVTVARNLKNIDPALLADVILPSITSQSGSQSVTVGSGATFIVRAAGTALTYQWYKDRVALSGATSATYTIASSAAINAGSYTCAATNVTGSVITNAATLTVIPTSYLSNLSVRAATDATKTLIVGFVVDGGAKPILVRAAGPTLTTLPFGLTGVLDPSLRLFNGATPAVLVDQNNDWSVNPATFSALGAFAFVTASKDSALQQTISGPHTAQATATNAGTILVEAYDAGPNDGRQLTNLSARFTVGTGDNIFIAGFVLAGTGTRQLLIRAVGPKLTDYGVPGVLADPQFAVFDGSTSIASNNDWPSALAPTFTTLGAFALTTSTGLPTNDTKSAANVFTLQAGKPYTVQVSGVSNTTGEALVEIYLVP